MKAVVVCESLWGTTAAVARATAEGPRPSARALSTAEGTGQAAAGSLRAADDSGAGEGCGELDEARRSAIDPVRSG